MSDYKVARDYKIVRIPHQQAPVGRVSGEVFHKRVHGSRHFLRQPPGIAFDVQSLMIAKKMGAVLVQVLDAETQRAYWQRISYILTNGFRLDRGHGQQVGLTFEHFKRSPSDLLEQPSLF